MDIRVYLTSGDVLAYCQNDPAVEAGLLADLNVGRLLLEKPSSLVVSIPVPCCSRTISAVSIC